MKNKERHSENKNKNKSNDSRLQSLMLCVLVLLLSHVLYLWIGKKTLSLNLFWYRFFEYLTSVALYIYFLNKEGTLY